MAAIFADDIFRRIFLNEKFCMLIKNSLKVVPKVAIDNKLALVQIMAWRRIGAIIWTNADPIHWRIYAALGGMSFNGHSVRSLRNKHTLYHRELVSILFEHETICEKSRNELND